MQSFKRTTFTVAGVAAAALLSLTACGGSATTAPSSSPAAAEPSASSMAPSPSASSPAAMDPAANLAGPGCAAYAEQVPSGAGSVSGMALDPVAVAASNNPLLKTLTAAVSGKLNPKVDLVDTLNGSEFTVFAPVDDAFAKLPADVVATLGTPEGAETLTAVLTYHVVPGQMSPDEISGEQETVQGGTVEVTGSGDNLQVNGASVICGGVQTANATVYLIDTVMMPPSMS